MPKGEIDIAVEPGSLKAHYDAISQSPHGRFYAGLFFLLFSVGLLCLMVFSHGKHSTSSIWEDLHAHPAESSRFLYPLGLLLATFVILNWYLARVIRVAYPGGQKLECDGHTLTISSIRWLDWDNSEWITESYPLQDVTRIRYGVIVSGRGNSTYGLKLRAAGRNCKLFPKLTTQQAGKILDAFEALGADTDRRKKAFKRNS